MPGFMPRRRSFARLIFRLAAWFVAVLAIGVVGGCGAVDRMLSPARHGVGPAPPDLAAEEVEIDSPSGNKLAAWFVPAADPQAARGVVVLLHGNRADRRQMLGRARFLRHAGFATLLADLSAHGASAGGMITFGVRESLDARAAVQDARRRLPDAPVAALGFSLGGASLALALPDLAVDALILEGVFPDLETAVRRRVWPASGWLHECLSALVLARIRSRLRIDEQAVKPVDRIGQARCPVLVIGGESDPFATPDDVERLRAAAPKGTSSWIVPGARHGDFHDAATAEYERRVGAFLTDAFVAAMRGSSR